MDTLKVEKDSLEKEKDDLVTRLWEQQKIQEGKWVLCSLMLSFNVVYFIRI